MKHEINKAKADYFARRVESIRNTVDTTGPRDRDFYKLEMAILESFGDIMKDRVFDDEEREMLMGQVDTFMEMVEEDDEIDTQEQEAVEIINEAISYLVKMDRATKASK